MNLRFMIQLQGLIPFKYKIIKRYSKNITHLKISDAAYYLERYGRSNDQYRYTDWSNNPMLPQGKPSFPPIKHEMFQNLVHLDISTFGFGGTRGDHNAGLKISSLNENLRYLRLSGLYQLNTTGMDPLIKS